MLAILAGVGRDSHCVVIQISGEPSGVGRRVIFELNVQYFQ
jgi:hypothetical protein